MNLNHRLRSIERSIGATAPAACPACGGGGGPDEVRLLPIEFDGEGRQVRRDAGPEFCPRCGRVLVIRLRPIVLDEKW